MSKTPAPLDLLRNTDLEIHPSEFALISVTKERWPELLADNSLSPSGKAPFLVFSDANEITLVLESSDLAAIKPGIGDSRVERGFRLLTFTTPMDFTVVGFFAEVARILAQAGVPILAVSSFSRDHLLIKQDHLPASLSALSPYVRVLC